MTFTFQRLKDLVAFGQNSFLEAERERVDILRKCIFIWNLQIQIIFTHLQAIQMLVGCQTADRLSSEIREKVKIIESILCETSQL